MVRTDTIPVYMLTWYKFHYGLNLMRPPAVCVPTVSGKPLSHLPAPTPTRPSIQVAIPASPSHISLYKVSTFLSRPLTRRWTALLLGYVRLIQRFEHVLRVAHSKLLYPTAKNKVLRVVSSHFGEVLRFIRQKIKFGESVDVPEVVDFRQQCTNKSRWT